MKALPRVAWYLGYGGLIPFFALTVAILLRTTLPLLDGVRHDWWLVTYAAVILSFLGAVHWGIVLGLQEWLTPRECHRMLVYGVTPSVLAWFAFLLPVNWALLMLGTLLVFAYIIDAMWLFGRIKSDYAKLRLHLTIVAALLLFAAAVGSS